MKILVIFGTRPEAIKMAPVVRALAGAGPEVEYRVCVTGQHREMLDQVLSVFSIVPDWDLDLMREGQDLSELTTRVLMGVQEVLRDWKPDLVLVHGDTTTSFAAALAAFYEQVDVGHVEAGLRTGDRSAPWPEEMNRRLTAVLATHHFAPTAGARENLLLEGVPTDRIWVTGNTVIDALLEVVEITRTDSDMRDAWTARFDFLDAKKRLIVVTGHRRENFGDGFESICRSLQRIASRPDVEIVYPVHLNPRVHGPVHSLLDGFANIHLIPPLDYLSFVQLLDCSYLIITDSGGVQEEAPALGKPVLVMRELTERPEGVEAGTVKVVGTDEDAIYRETVRLLEDPGWYECVSHSLNPYGDGRAASRIVNALLGEEAQPLDQSFKLISG